MKHYNFIDMCAFINYFAGIVEKILKLRSLKL